MWYYGLSALHALHKCAHTAVLFLLLCSMMINAELRRIVSLLAFFCLAPLSVVYNLFVSSLQ